MNPNLSPDTIEWLKRGVRGGALVSDGPVPADFAEGLGLHPFRGRLAHYWTADRSQKAESPDVYGIVSACGMRTVVTDKVPLLGPGNYRMCSRCDEALLRHVRGRR